MKLTCISFSVNLVNRLRLIRSALMSGVWGWRAEGLMFTHQVCLFKAAQDFTTLLDSTLNTELYLPWTPSPCWTLRSPRTAGPVTPWSPPRRGEPGPPCQHPSVAWLGWTSPETATETTVIRNRRGWLKCFSKAFFICFVDRVKPPG